jgi:hypothetical protein
MFSDLNPTKETLNILVSNTLWKHKRKRLAGYSTPAEMMFEAKVSVHQRGLAKVLKMSIRLAKN